MSLRHALIGLLADQPASGWDLTRRFEGLLGAVWPAGHPQIYGELRKLEADGLIEIDSEGPRRRKTYHATEVGIEAEGLTRPSSMRSVVVFPVPVRILFRLTSGNWLSTGHASQNGRRLGRHPHRRCRLPPEAADDRLLRVGGGDEPGSEQPAEHGSGTEHAEREAGHQRG